MTSPRSRYQEALEQVPHHDDCFDRNGGPYSGCVAACPQKVLRDALAASVDRGTSEKVVAPHDAARAIRDELAKHRQQGDGSCGCGATTLHDESHVGNMILGAVWEAARSVDRGTSAKDIKDELPETERNEGERRRGLRWLNAALENDAIELCVTENGDVGVFRAGGGEGEKALGSGDSAGDALEDAWTTELPLKHPASVDRGHPSPSTTPSQTVSEAERTVASLAAMLGWMNVPPREVLEADLRALKARVAPPSGQPSFPSLDAQERERLATWCDAQAANVRHRPQYRADMRAIARYLRGLGDSRVAPTTLSRWRQVGARLLRALEVVSNGAQRIEAFDDGPPEEYDAMVADHALDQAERDAAIQDLRTLLSGQPQLGTPDTVEG